MLEFNKWFFVLVVNFLVLLYVLNAVLFRPLLKIFKEREENVDGSIREAKEMDEKKETLIAEMHKELSGAAARAKARFEEFKKEGTDKQKAAVGEAGNQAASTLDKARVEIRAEAEKARQSLRADVEKFSEEIVRKLVGV